MRTPSWLQDTSVCCSDTAHVSTTHLQSYVGGVGRYWTYVSVVETHSVTQQNVLKKMFVRDTFQCFRMSLIMCDPAPLLCVEEYLSLSSLYLALSNTSTACGLPSLSYSSLYPLLRSTSVACWSLCLPSSSSYPALMSLLLCHPRPMYSSTKGMRMRTREQ